MVQAASSLGSTTLQSDYFSFSFFHEQKPTFLAQYSIPFIQRIDLRVVVNLSTRLQKHKTPTEPLSSVQQKTHTEGREND